MTPPPGDARRDAFFVGWSTKSARPLAGFLGPVAAGVLGGLALLAVLLSGSVADPGPGDFDWAAGEQTLRGALTARPYPLLHLPDGSTVLLSGEGKRGAPLAAGLGDGAAVEATGLMLRRGTIRMMQVNAEPVPAGAAAGAAPVPPPIPLGRWRITGEVCDGKCYAGAMRPGSGLAHRACAVLCIAGGVPPVFVSAAPVEGQQFMLLAGPDGGPWPEAAWRRLAALRVRLDGELEKRGDLLVFRADPAAVAAGAP